MHQQLWGYKVEETYVGVREQKRLNTADLDNKLNCRTRRILAAITKDVHWFLFWTQCIQSVTSYLISLGFVSVFTPIYV
jgi:hypothetical protein